MTSASTAPAHPNALPPHALGTPPAAYRSVLAILQRLGPHTVLDCAAGQGAFARELLDQKYDVRCCDIYPGDFKLEDVPCEFSDLNDRIPFENDSFDALTCLSALQRVWARGRALSEMARVLKPGGHLVLTMFNNNNLMRRAMFLTSGSIVFDTCGPPYAFAPEADNPAACFRYPITIGDVMAGLASVGLELESLDAILWSKGSLCLAPLALVPLLLQPLVPSRYQQACHPRQASSAKVLFKDCLVFVARKPIA